MHAAAAWPPTRLDVTVQDAVGVALRQRVQHRAHVGSHLQQTIGAQAAKVRRQQQQQP